MSAHKKVILASHHQGDARYGSYAGSQCVANVQSFFANAATFQIEDIRKKDLDGILYLGNTIYDYAKLKCKQTLLLPTELPAIVGDRMWRCSVTPTGILYGQCTSDLDEINVGIARAFGIEKYLYFTAKDTCVGLLNQDEKYYCFDSHARDKNGYTCCTGKACLIKFSSFNQLTSYLAKQYGQNSSERFQIVTCKVQTLPNCADSQESGPYVDENAFYDFSSISEDVVLNSTYTEELLNSSRDEVINAVSTEANIWHTILNTKHNKSPVSPEVLLRTKHTYALNADNNEIVSHSGLPMNINASCTSATVESTNNNACPEVPVQNHTVRNGEKTGIDNNRSQKLSPLASAAHASIKTTNKNFSEKTDEFSSNNENAVAEKKKEKNVKRYNLRTQHKRECVEGIATNPVYQKVKESVKRRNIKRRNQNKTRTKSDYSDVSTVEELGDESSNPNQNIATEPSAIRNSKNADYHINNKRRIRDKYRSEKAKQANMNNVDSGQNDAEQEPNPCNVTTTENGQSFDFGREMLDCLNRGCDYICCSCEQIYFAKSIVKISEHRQPIYEKYIRTNDISLDANYYACHTCNSAITQGKIPKLSRYNGMHFPTIPPELKISAKEASLISPRIVFLNIHVLPRGCQLSLYGNVISVPSEIEIAVSSLPRFVNAEGTVSLRLKR